MFADMYNGRRVLVTGHTGFKGSWLCLWLENLGAEVYGYSLSPKTDPSHFQVISASVHSNIADIRDYDHLYQTLRLIGPDVVFHLAAQPLVRQSYALPIETLQVNTLGTVNLLEACRHVDSVKAVINITSDKCYENREWVWGYRENDAIGGHDPYSLSKACSELITKSWRNCFFPLNQYGKKHHKLLASVRAGNVIGGGDWSEDRLIPDIVRAIKSKSPVIIRNPHATRPWQHVLEPLSGYLLLGQNLLEGRSNCASAWNFGPTDEGNIKVGKVVSKFYSQWNAFEYQFEQGATDHPHEAGLLKLDCSKAKTALNWQPVWNADIAVEKTAAWYKNFYENHIVNTKRDLEEYIQSAKEQRACWIE